MSDKHTFVSLCEAFDKIEIPIIQRDYAQGRETLDVKKIREKFIDKFLIPNFIDDNPTELDFVYGSVLSEQNGKKELLTFIPLDGQQRLTTLFLLHYFLAVKENRLSEVRDLLARFKYETRSSASDFCRNLIHFDDISDLSDIRNSIIDSKWFDLSWLKDSTVSGMLNVLDGFSKNQDLMCSNHNLLEKLIDSEKALISFYFTDLKEFGLTENLYIRMNARGKMLTDFENFKSEFFKIISYSSDLQEQVKDKIEYSWVENLWSYREKESYIIDRPFMNFLKFITEMLYFKDAESHSSPTYPGDFLDLKVLADIYLVESNLQFLIFALDNIPKLQERSEFIYWNNQSISYVLAEIISGRYLIDHYFIIYSAFQYLFVTSTDQDLYDFLRVVRNLIVNTNDKSQREWPTLLSSVNNLITDKNVYLILTDDSIYSKLQGFNTNQRREEIFKAFLISNYPAQKSNIFIFEDHRYLKGNIQNLLIAPFAHNEFDYTSLTFNDLQCDEKYFKDLSEIFKAYEEISTNNFNPIWGNLLNTDIYRQTSYSRLDLYGDLQKNPAIFQFAKEYAQTISNEALDNYIISKQKTFVTGLLSKYKDLSSIRNVKEQLYIYYIMHERIYNKKYNSFFKNDNYNFGWLDCKSGYKSIFTKGIEGCQYFPQSNPIFQVYNQQFRYNLGINKNNTLDEEIVGTGNKRDPFDALIKWAST